MMPAAMLKRLLLAALLLTACSEDSRPRDSGDGGQRIDSGTPPDSGTAPDTGVEDAGISTRDPSCDPSAAWVTSVRGTITDGDGAPSEASKAQLCLRTSPNNVLLCLRPEDSIADGTFTIDVPENARCFTEATMRFFRPLADVAASYCAIELAGIAEAVTLPRPFRLFPTTRATVLPPRGDAMMSRTIQFAGGLELELIPGEFYPGGGEYEELAAAPVQIDPNDTCLLAGESGFDGVYAFSPEGDIKERGRLRIPNTSRLPANTRVRVFTLGGLGCAFSLDDPLPEGEWVEIEPSMVSADGNTITVDPGVPCLSWVAYRAE
jgi:hypothetical protein